MFGIPEGSPSEVIVKVQERDVRFVTSSYCFETRSMTETLEIRNCVCKTLCPQPYACL